MTDYYFDYNCLIDRNEHFLNYYTGILISVGIVTMLDRMYDFADWTDSISI